MYSIRYYPIIIKKTHEHKWNVVLQKIPLNWPQVFLQLQTKCGEDGVDLYNDTCFEWQSGGLSSVGLFCGVSSLICVKKLCQQMAAGILSGHGQNVFSRCQFDTSLRNRVDSNFPDSVIEVARKPCLHNFYRTLISKYPCSNCLPWYHANE